MSPLSMSRAEREEFLAGLHVGVLSVASDDGGGPLTVPVWYTYQPGGTVNVSTGRSTRKARAIESAGRFINQTEWFFLLRGPSFDVRTDGLEALEKTFIREYRWWSLDEIRRSTEEFAPRDLADRLHDLVIQGPPASPVEVGR